MEILTLEPLAGITESVEYLTSVIQCQTSESREALRETPRTELKLSFRVSSSEDFYFLKAFEERHGIEPFLLPYWLIFERVSLTYGATSITLQDNSEFYLKSSKQLLLWKSTLEYQQIEVAEGYTSGNTFQLSNPVTLNSGIYFILPLYESLMKEVFSFSKESGAVKRAEASFVSTEIPQIELNNWGTFENFKVFPLPGILSEKLSDQTGWDTELIDSSLGTFSKELQTFYAKKNKTFVVKAFKKPEGKTLQKALNFFQGMLTPFWFPSFNEDINPPFIRNPQGFSIELSKKFYPNNTSKTFSLQGDTSLLTTGTFIDVEDFPFSTQDSTKQILQFLQIPNNLKRIQEYSLLRFSSDTLTYEWSGRENNRLHLSATATLVPLDRSYAFSDLYPLLVIPKLSLSGTITSLTRHSILQESFPLTSINLTGTLTALSGRIVFKDIVQPTFPSLSLSGTILSLTQRWVFNAYEASPTSDLALSGTITALTRRSILSFAEYNLPASLSLSGTLLTLTRQVV